MSTAWQEIRPAFDLRPLTYTLCNTKQSQCSVIPGTARHNGNISERGFWWPPHCFSLLTSSSALFSAQPIYTVRKRIINWFDAFISNESSDIVRTVQPSRREGQTDVLVLLRVIRPLHRGSMTTYFKQDEVPGTVSGPATVTTDHNLFHNRGKGITFHFIHEYLTGYTQMEQQRLTVLKEILGPKKDQVTDDWSEGAKWRKKPTGRPWRRRKGIKINLQETG